MSAPNTPAPRETSATNETTALDAAVRVELERDYARNLINSTNPDDLSPGKLAEYREHVQKIVHAYKWATRVGPSEGNATGLYGGVRA